MLFVTNYEIKFFVDVAQSQKGVESALPFPERKGVAFF